MENQPTPEQKERIKQITDFHSDLLRLRDLLNKHEMEVSTAHNSHKKPPEYPKEAESLRQSLIRRSGPVKAITDRLAGVMVLPLPYSRGQVEAWQLALHPTEHFSQAYFVGAIADQVLTAIGTAEYDPALLNPPKPAEPKSTG